MKKQINLSITGRKLNLNKKTISNLTTVEMNKKVGGSYFGPGGGCGNYGGNNSKNCTQNQNTCPGHNTCYNC